MKEYDRIRTYNVLSKTIFWLEVLMVFQFNMVRKSFLTRFSALFHTFSLNKTTQQQITKKNFVKKPIFF